MERKIYKDLLEWKNNNIQTPLMVLGARQIGKTYIIDEFCKNEFDNYVYINLLEQKDVIELYKSNDNSEEKFKKLQFILNKDINLDNTIIFIDEIQESEELISELKFFCENIKPFKIICAGSLLGVKLNRFSSSFPVGKVKLITMYPMNFEEFLIALGHKNIIKDIKKCFEENKPMVDVIHNKLIDLYRLYLCIGGMPNAVLNLKSVDNILECDKSILEDIINAYLNDMNKYVVNITESPKIEAIYKSIPSQLANPSNKFQYKKVDDNARRRNYESALNWLLSSRMILKSNSVNKVEIPLKAFIEDNTFKLYLSDVGLLTRLLEINYSDIILDKNFMYKGVIAENYVACELQRLGRTLCYWNSGNKAEIDFLLYNEDGIIPIEVKANINNQSKSLNNYVEKYNPPYSIRISNKNFGFENNIKSVPLYAVFCIK